MFVRIFPSKSIISFIIIYRSLNNDDAGRIQVIVKSLGFTQEFRAENDILAVELLTNRSGVTNRNRRLDNHDGVRIVFHDQLDHSLDSRCIKMLRVAVVVPPPLIRRKNSNRVEYNVHFSSYVGTFSIFPFIFRRKEKSHRSSDQ